MNSNYKYIFSYLYGNIDEELKTKLEKDENFMRQVIKMKPNVKDYYYNCPESLKKDLFFIEDLIMANKDDHLYIKTIAEDYFEKMSDDSRGYYEISILLSNIYEETLDEELYDYYERSYEYFLGIMDAVDNEILSIEDLDEREEVGRGFIIIDMSFSESEIVRS